MGQYCHYCPTRVPSICTTLLAICLLSSSQPFFKNRSYRLPWVLCTATFPSAHSQHFDSHIFMASSCVFEDGFHWSPSHFFSVVLSTAVPTKNTLFRRNSQRLIRSFGGLDSSLYTCLGVGEITVNISVFLLIFPLRL